MSKLLRPLLLILLGLVLGIGGYYLLRDSSKPTPPTIEPEQLRLQISQRLRLITEEITYREDVDIYHAGQHAVGTADLIAYVKYDLEGLQLTPQGTDTCYVTLPEPELELGRRPRGAHSIRYYLDQGGRPGAPSADREAIRQLNKLLLQRAEEDIRTNPRFLHQAEQHAQEQLGLLLTSLAPNIRFIFTQAITLPSPELSPFNDQRQ